MIHLQKYDGRRGSGDFRPMTLEEAKQFPQDGRVWFQSLSGDARQAKVTSVKTWKRDSDRIEFRLKYGMYEYITFTKREIDEARLLVEVAS